MKLVAAWVKLIIFLYSQIIFIILKYGIYREAIPVSGYNIIGVNRLFVESGLFLFLGHIHMFLLIFPLLASLRNNWELSSSTNENAK